MEYQVKLSMKSYMVYWGTKKYLFKRIKGAVKISCSPHNQKAAAATLYIVKARNLS